MMVADVEFLQAVLQGAHDLRVAMTQVEDAAVAMAVDQARSPVTSQRKGPSPPARDKIDAGRLKEVDLTRRYVPGKAIGRAARLL